MFFFRNFNGAHYKNHRNSLTYRGAVLNLKRVRNQNRHQHQNSRHPKLLLRPASSCPDIISVATDDKSVPVRIVESFEET